VRPRPRRRKTSRAWTTGALILSYMFRFAAPLTLAAASALAAAPAQVKATAQTLPGGERR